MKYIWRDCSFTNRNGSPTRKEVRSRALRDFFLMTELNEAGDDANKSGNDDEDKSLSKKLVPPKVCNSLPRAPLIKRLCLIRSSESPDIHKSENCVMN